MEYAGSSPVLPAKYIYKGNKLKIILQPPFTKEYCRAYLSVSNKDGRARVTLFREDGTGTFMQYARYLMCVKENRILSDFEEVDHIDKDKTNDSPDNLQILTINDHKVKTKLEGQGRATKTIVCENCGKEFQREVRQIKYNKSFCSRTCSGVFYSSRTNNLIDKKITDDDIVQIKCLMKQGLSSYKIANILTHISRSTISRCMKKIKEG